jgi:glycine betaine/proline transport system substrate-binding protein
VWYSFRRLVAALCAILAVALPVMTAKGAEVAEPVKLSLLGSSDADFIMRSLGQILKRAGYNVEYVNVDYTASFQAVQDGDVHVALLWDSTYDQGLPALRSGYVNNYGSTGVEIREGWWYPPYMVEICPGLPDWTALQSPDCISALATPSTAPKARLLDGPADWSPYSAEKIAELGLNMEAISGGSPGALAAAVQGMLERKEPVIAWGWQPHPVFNLPGSDFVRLPGITIEGYAWKLGNRDFFLRALLADRILHLFALDAETVARAMKRADADGVPMDEVAAQWVFENEALWRKWIR